MKKTVRVLFVIAILILLGVFIYSTYRLTSTLHEYREADRYYSAQAGQFASFADPSSPGAPQASPAPGEEQDFAPLQEISPRVIDFPSLLATCPDVKGWLYSPDTVIDYPVVQGKDNDYYLHRFMDGSYNPNGTLFIDFRCAGDYSGPNTVIYGHHMQNGTMLASLEGYRQQEYYDEHPVMYLNTPDGDYRLDLFSAFVTWYDSRVYTFTFDSDTDFEQWYTLMKSYSSFESPVELSPEDRIVTLSTCTYDYDNARFVVLGKLVPLADPS